MTAPDRITVRNGKANQLRLLECSAPFAAYEWQAEYVRRDPAVLAEIEGGKKDE